MYRADVHEDQTSLLEMVVVIAFLMIVAEITAEFVPRMGETAGGADAGGTVLSPKDVSA